MVSYFPNLIQTYLFGIASYLSHSLGKDEKDKPQCLGNQTCWMPVHVCAMALSWSPPSSLPIPKVVSLAELLSSGALHPVAARLRSTSCIFQAACTCCASVEAVPDFPACQLFCLLWEVSKIWVTVFFYSHFVCYFS